MSVRISPEHAKQYQQYHLATPYVRLPSRWLERVEALAKKLDAQSILDYGSGPSRGISSYLPNVEVRDYDPGVIGLDHEPEPADLVACIHTLEHVEPECLAAVVADLHILARKALFVVVSCQPSTKVLPDGTAWHTFVRDARWWKAYLVDFIEQPILKEPGMEYAALLELR